MVNYNDRSPLIMFIGHVAIDSIIRFKKIRKPSLGGSVSFGSLALSSYTPNVRIKIISNVGNEDVNNSLLKPLIKHQVDLSGINWMKTRNTNFILDYSNHSRSLFLKSRSPDINFDDINHNAFLDPPDIIVLVPLCNEISNEFVEKIAGRFPNAMIGMDLQGFIRKIDADGKVSYIYDDFILANIKKIIDSVGDRLILKGSEIEMKLLAQKEDSHEVMDFFNSFGTKGIFIMTLGENGSIILKKGENLLEIPAYKSNGVVDETGAGDVYLAIFLYEIFNTNQTWGDIEQAARYASSAASFLIEKKGPNGFKSRDKIIKRTNKGVYTNKI